MKRIMVPGVWCGLLLWGGVAVATEAASTELGKTLFEATALGSNGKSCSSCHPGGKGLGEAAVYPDGQLREMVNFCIRDALQGKMLAPDSQELAALAGYVRGFAAKP